jgi:hypothetical protein
MQFYSSTWVKLHAILSTFYGISVGSGEPKKLPYLGDCSLSLGEECS